MKDEKIKSLKDRISVDSVTVSRKLSGRNGDVLLSKAVSIENGISLEESEVVALLLSYSCQKGTIRHARAGSLITDEEMKTAEDVLKKNFRFLLGRELDD